MKTLSPGISIWYKDRSRISRIFTFGSPFITRHSGSSFTVSHRRPNKHSFNFSSLQLLITLRLNVPPCKIPPARLCSVLYSENSSLIMVDAFLLHMQTQERMTNFIINGIN